MERIHLTEEEKKKAISIAQWANTFQRSRENTCILLKWVKGTIVWEYIKIRNLMNKNSSQE